MLRPQHSDRHLRLPEEADVEELYVLIDANRDHQPDLRGHARVHSEDHRPVDREQRIPGTVGLGAQSGRDPRCGGEPPKPGNSRAAGVSRRGHPARAEKSWRSLSRRRCVLDAGSGLASDGYNAAGLHSLWPRERQAIEEMRDADVLDLAAGPQSCLLGHVPGGEVSGRCHRDDLA